MRGLQSVTERRPVARGRAEVHALRLHRAAAATAHPLHSHAPFGRHGTQRWVACKSAGCGRPWACRPPFAAGMPSIAWTGATHPHALAAPTSQGKKSPPPPPGPSSAALAAALPGPAWLVGPVAAALALAMAL